MSFDEPWPERLIKAAGQRGIALSESETRTIRAAPADSLLQTWIEENFGSTEPLSTEEFELWHNVGKDSAAHDEHADKIQRRLPLTEEDFRLAVESLETSTQATERQASILRSQLALTGDLISQDGTIKDKKHKFNTSLGQRKAAEIQHVKFANEQLRDTFHAELQTEAVRTAKEMKAVHSVVSELLNADDRALEELNALSDSRTQSPWDFDQVSANAARLFAALELFQAAAVKDRLDFAYLEALHAPHTPENITDVASEAAASVQAELNSLYTEIDDVVTMTVAEQHRNPMEHALQAARHSWQQTQVSKLQRMLIELASITQSAEHLSSRLEQLQSQRAALHSLSSRFTTLDATTKNVALEKNKPRNNSQEEHHPPTALGTLLQHFDLNADKKSPPGPTTNITEQMKTLLSQMHKHSTQNIDYILAQTEAEVAQRQRFIEEITRATGHDSLSDSLHDLDQQIAAAKTTLEQLS